MLVSKVVIGIVTAASSFGGGIAWASSPSTSYAPAPHKSWVGQEKAEIKCASVEDDSSWEDCLVSSWEKYTGKKLSADEYETNGAKGTWKVTWSHVTLPSGGKAMNKAAKEVYKIPVTVYCKSYEGVVLCNNGFRHE